MTGVLFFSQILIKSLQRKKILNYGIIIEEEPASPETSEFGKFSNPQ